MRQEINLRQSEFARAALHSIYFGGGTPSLLSSKELEQFFQEISAQHPLSEQLEISLEANPDDLDEATVAALAASPVNRLSVGIQSFQEADLRFMNRAHSAVESTKALQLVQAAGFHNISIDLIYGSPTTTAADWRDNLQQVIDFGIPHISAYALTVEPKTALAHQIASGKSPAVDEQLAALQFEVLVETLREAGYVHYEISNFAKPGYESQHNSSYWQGQAYIGIGPSAHSFDGLQERRWNIAHNARYQQLIHSIDSVADYQEIQGLYTAEILSKADRYNERVMTGLRTSKGVDFVALEGDFGPEFSAYFKEQLQEEIKRGQLLWVDQQFFRLAPTARFLADGIAAQAFWV